LKILSEPSAGDAGHATGNHACCLYATAREHQIAVTHFLMEGLDRDEKLVCSVQADPEQDVLRYLREESVDPVPLLDSGQLVIVPARTAYLSHGRFSLRRALRRIEDILRDGREQGYPGVRITGDVSWLSRRPDARDSFFEYEKVVTHLLMEYGASALCQYDRRRFDAGDLLRCLATHPMAMVDHEWIRNPYFVEPHRLHDEDILSVEAAQRREAIREIDELRGQARVLERILANLDAAVFVIDSRARTILECNATAEAMFGHSRDALLGNGTGILHVDDGQHRWFGEASLEALRQGRSFHTESAMRRADGAVFPTRHSVALLDPERGLDGGVVSLVWDLTEEKRAREALKRSEAQLRQSQKMEAVGRLAGGLAHDFNNLLTVIRAHAELGLEDLPSDSPLREELQHIIREVEGGAGLTRRLLSFSRTSPRGEHRTLDLREPLLDLEPLLRRLVPARIGVEVDPGPEPAWVRADPAELHHAIMNLVVNAIHAMDEGGVLSLAIGAPDDGNDVLGPVPSDAGGWVRLSVRDTGTGMTPEVQERIFEPFFTTKAPDEGTGLGLPMVFGLVRQCGGHVGVESTPGRGTAVHILLPRFAEGTGDGAGTPRA
jgi:PAS domain S-box-containing protein